MTSTRQTPYHHGNLRPVLVDTAVDLARSAGPDGVVLREVARRAGVTHNAAYRHFADRAALLAEVAGRAMDTLEAAMVARTDAVTEQQPVARAIERLRETGRAYVEFAVTEPGLFAVAFTSPTGPSLPIGEDEKGGPYDVLNGVLDELVACGAVAPERRAGAEVGCWAAVHGLSELVVHGPLRDLPVTERGPIVETLLDLLQGGLLR